MSILLFGGTVEGRLLAQWCGARGIAVTLSVATDYGAELAAGLPGVAVRTGRLDRGGMEALMAQGFTGVVDATHPYAAEVSALIRAAAQVRGLPLLRLVRDGAEEGDWLRVDSPQEAADRLAQLPGNVLLTTGSKDLPLFARGDLRVRCVPRVLPSLDSLGRCLELGFPQNHIICMQGPFSRALNEAMIAQYAIKTLVTKATGQAGGFWDKAAAAQSTGCTLLVIGRPAQETGVSLEKLKEMLLGGWV